MTVKVIDQAGFCFGVRRATALAFETAHKHTDGVFTLGPLIHNPQVVKKLEEAGVEVTDELSGRKHGTLIVRSHGLHPELLEQARERGIEIIDAACLFVKKVQNYADQLDKEGYQVVVIGDKNHPEVQSIGGYTKRELVVIGHPEEVKQVKLTSRLGVVAQTTQGQENFKAIVAQLLGRAREIKVYNTICKATQIRQAATLKLAQQVELMLVVGGRNSANTNRLAEICRRADTSTYLVEVAEEIDSVWLEGKREIGISAGASTPEWIIREVLEKVKGYTIQMYKE